MIPDSITRQMQPYAASGGALGADGLLYLSGHDKPEVYVLAAPRMGPKLIHVATISVDIEGQAIVWDDSAERVLMLEHAVYSVISPEGCASILWRTAEKAPDAAEAMKVTAQDLESLGVIDRIVGEPVGGAHRNPVAAAKALGEAIGEELDMLSRNSADELKRMREERFLKMAG